MYGTTSASSRNLLINIFLCDPFFVMNETDFWSYADDNTPYRTADTIDEVIKLQEHDSTISFKWFSDNQMKANISKCHLLVNTKGWGGYKFRGEENLKWCIWKFIRNEWIWNVIRNQSWYEIKLWWTSATELMLCQKLCPISESISYIWDIVPLELKELTHSAFKKSIKNGNQKIFQAGYVSYTYQI